MDKEIKKELLVHIEELIAYGRKDPTIDPNLLKYLDIESLISIKKRLITRSKDLKEEDKRWLEQFRKEE